MVGKDKKALPHFCLENLPSKFLPCKLTLRGEEVKTLTIFSTLAKNSVNFFSQKGFTRAFLLLFATFSTFAVIAATRRA